MTDNSNPPPQNFLTKANDFLDRYILPWPVRYLTFRIRICMPCTRAVRSVSRPMTTLTHVRQTAP